MSKKWFNAPNAPVAALDLGVRGRKPKRRRVWVHVSWPLLWCCVFCPCVGHAPCLSLPCLPLNCSHLACIVSSTPLQIHLVSLQSSPDRTSCYRGSYSFLAPVYLSSVLSCGILVPHLCFLSPIVFGLSPPACSLHSLQPDTPHSNQPPASLLAELNKPVHRHSNSCPVSVFCSWVQQLTLP